MPGILLQRECDSVVVRDCSVLGCGNPGDAWVGHHRGQIALSEAVEIEVPEQLVVAAIPDLICGEDCVRCKHLMDLEIPFHVLGISQVAVDLVQVGY